jgi:hypothetical protein
MKNRDKHIEKKVEHTLQALDGMERARPKPFLYTRIKARLEKGAPQSQGALILQPVFQRAALVMIVLVILINLYTATRFFAGPVQEETIYTSEQLFIEEYYPSTPTLYNISQNISNP